MQVTFTWLLSVPKDHVEGYVSICGLFINIAYMFLRYVKGEKKYERNHWKSHSE